MDGRQRRRFGSRSFSSTRSVRSDDSARHELSPLPQEPIVNHEFVTWPLPNTKHERFYLGSEGLLLTEPPHVGSRLSYQADAPAQQVDNDIEELLISYTFERRAFFIGRAKAVIYASCAAHNDLDVYVQLRKADKDGKLLQNLNIPLSDLKISSADDDTFKTNPNFYLGPTGVLRASHRAVSSSLSGPDWAVHDHSWASIQPVEKGQIVKLEIGLWPTAMAFEPGERLVLKLAGHPLTLVEFVPLRGTFEPDNKGKHEVYVGGEFQSHVVVPFVEL